MFADNRAFKKLQLEGVFEINGSKYFWTPRFSEHLKKVNEFVLKSSEANKLFRSGIKVGMAKDLQNDIFLGAILTWAYITFVNNADPTNLKQTFENSPLSMENKLAVMLTFVKSGAK